MTSTREIILFLKENKKLFREQFYCKEIGLFGSFARNEQTDKSDIDILVEFEPGTPDLFSVESGLKDYLREKFKRDIDICAKKWIKPVFRPLVMKEAIYV
ncbi:MAG: nucleotidyltransferase family protein [Prolixibacteraceae bacterium]|nr:nucleotidyltransferase family protein [Prolixibacteraceae bacterium]